MATLSIRNFPTDLHRRLKERARRERRSLAQQVICILEYALEEEERLSILDIEGLGLELWEEEDAARFS